MRTNKHDDQMCIHRMEPLHHKDGLWSLMYKGIQFVERNVDKYTLSKMCRHLSNLELDQVISNHELALRKQCASTA